LAKIALVAVVTVVGFGMQDAGSTGDGADTKTEIVNRWHDLLAGASYLRYELDVIRSHRTLSGDEENGFDYIEHLDGPYGTFAAKSEEHRKAWLENKVALYAEVVMGPDCLFLNVWRRDESGAIERDRPAVTLAFHDGRVHERVWFPAAAQYRTLHYPSQTEWGPGDLKTPYEEGCMIGASLWTWVGESAHNDWFVRAMRADGSLLANPVSCGEETCRVLRRTTSNEQSRDGDVMVVHRTQDFHFNDQGERIRWRDVTFAKRAGGGSSIVVVDSRFDFTFMEELPDEIKDYLASDSDSDTATNTHEEGDSE